MRVLGIESSCDETAAAVVTGDGEVLASLVSSQVPLHARFGGVIPEIASRNHLLAVGPLVEQALRQAGAGLDGIDRIAVTLGPGLLGSLMVGVQFAKGLALACGRPLVPVHHVEGHITAALLRDGAEHPHGELRFPYVALAVSGGHSSLYVVVGAGEYRVLGMTIDDAAGEAFDKVARILGLPYPGGVEIDRLSRAGDRTAVRFPRPKAARPFDFSFSGLKTAVRQFLERRGAGPAESAVPLADVAASFQEAVVDVLCGRTVEAARAQGVGDVVLSGGVAANSRLRERFAAAASEAGMRAHLTRREYCTDNAAMIAGAAIPKPLLPREEQLALEPFASGHLAPAI